MDEYRGDQIRPNFDSSDTAGLKQASDHVSIISSLIGTDYCSWHAVWLQYGLEITGFEWKRSLT